MFRDHCSVHPVRHLIGRGLIPATYYILANIRTSLSAFCFSLSVSFSILTYIKRKDMSKYFLNITPTLDKAIS